MTPEDNGVSMENKEYGNRNVTAAHPDHLSKEKPVGKTGLSWESSECQAHPSAKGIS